MTGPPSLFKDALSGRYAIEHELGRGGSGTVYLARDLRHDRNVALKLLNPELAASLGSERFLREVALTAKLSHPHILPLLDSGQVGGLLYYAMPYAEGESLRDRLIREGQLSLDESLQIAREVAEALAYAHDHGVIHRDIKPGNILLSGGHAVLADFGIARAITAAAGDRLTETGMAVGTPGYMSPEQATGAEQLDGRTDLYSLGCVVYEMLAGQPPFTGTSAQAVLARQMLDPVPPLSTVRRSVPPHVERAVLKALEKVPADRFATAQGFASAISGPAGTSTPSTARPRIARHVWAIGLAVAALGVVIGIQLLSPGDIGFAERDQVVVADFENSTGDAVFEGSLGSALTVGLQQSRFVNVLPRPVIAQILGQMKLPDTTRLQGEVARRLALRANTRVLVVPSIDRIDSTYILTTRIIDPSTGTELQARSARAKGKGGVLPALDDLVRRLRRDLGESRGAVAEDGLRLDQATTASLEALRAWTEGNRYWSRNRLDDAAARYREALRLDSNFAMAHKTLGEYFAWTARRDSSDFHFAKALNELDRVTERERLLIQVASHSGRSEWNEAIQAQETLLDRYPDDQIQRFNLGSMYMRADRPADAIRTLRLVLATDSTNVWALINLATAYVRADSGVAALSQYRRAFALMPEYRLSGNLNHEFGFTFVAAGQLDSAEATFTAMLNGSPDQQASGHRSLGLLRMYQGRYGDARTHLERARELTHAAGAPVSEFRNLLYLAATWASAGNTRAARGTLRAAAAIADTVFLAPTWLRRLAAGYARLGDTVAVKKIAALIADRASPESPEDVVAVAGTEGLLALTRGDHARALERLQRAALNSADDATMYRPALATAYLLSGATERAESTWIQVIHSPGALGWEPQESWFLARYELGRLYEDRGDTAHATQYYQELIDLWNNGDPDLVILADARRRLLALQPAD